MNKLATVLLASIVPFAAHIATAAGTGQMESPPPQSVSDNMVKRGGTTGEKPSKRVKKTKAKGQAGSNPAGVKTRGGTGQQTSVPPQSVSGSTTKCVPNPPISSC